MESPNDVVRRMAAEGRTAGEIISALQDAGHNVSAMQASEINRCYGSRKWSGTSGPANTVTPAGGDVANLTALLDEIADPVLWQVTFSQIEHCRKLQEQAQDCTTVAGRCRRAGDVAGQQAAEQHAADLMGEADTLRNVSGAPLSKLMQVSHLLDEWHPDMLACLPDARYLDTLMADGPIALADKLRQVRGRVHSLELMSRLVIVVTAGQLWRAYTEGKQPAYQCSAVSMSLGRCTPSITCPNDADEVKRTTLDRAEALVTAEGGDKASAMEKLMARVQLTTGMDKRSVLNMLLADFVAAAGGREPARGGAAKVGGGNGAGESALPRITKEEANLRAREALKGKPSGGGRWSVRKLAKAVGCAVGLVPELPAWWAYLEANPVPTKPGKREVATSKASFDTVAKFCPDPNALNPAEIVKVAELGDKATSEDELVRLIAESNADNEADPSPLSKSKRRFAK